MHSAPPTSPIAPTPSPTNIILPFSPPLPPPSAIAPPLWVADAVVLALVLLTTGTVAIAVPVVAVDVVVGAGNESDVEFGPTSQNCWASCSVEFNKSGHVLDIHETIPFGNFPLTQKQLMSMTLVQFASEIAVSKHVVAQGGTPVRLGNCAVLVKVALADELALEREVAVELPEEDEAGDVRVKL